MSTISGLKNAMWCYITSSAIRFWCKWQWLLPRLFPVVVLYLECSGIAGFTSIGCCFHCLSHFAKSFVFPNSSQILSLRALNIISTWCLAGNTLVWLLLNRSTHYCIIIHAPHFSYFIINLFPLCFIATSGLLSALSVQCAVGIDMEMSCLGLLPTKFGTVWHSEFHHQWISVIVNVVFRACFNPDVAIHPVQKAQKAQKARQSFCRSQVYWLGIGPV